MHRLTVVCVSQITMRSGRLLLLLCVVSSQCVDSQPTIDDDDDDDGTCGVGAGLLRPTHTDMERILDNQQQLFQQQQIIMSRLGEKKLVLPLPGATVNMFVCSHYLDNNTWGVKIARNRAKIF